MGIFIPFFILPLKGSDSEASLQNMKGYIIYFVIWEFSFTAFIAINELSNYNEMFRRLALSGLIYFATLISHLLIVEHVHGQFLIERKFLDIPPASEGILEKY